MTTPAADAWLEAIRELVRAEVRTALSFSGLCEYRVVTSPGAGGDNTIDAVPVDQQAGLPPVQGVSVRTGLPGGTVQVAQNALVALAFLDQNPSKPFFVGAFDSTGALVISIDVNLIKLGANPTTFAALASKVDACMTAIKTHVHSGVTTGAGSSGPSPTLTSLPATGSAVVAIQ